MRALTFPDAELGKALQRKRHLSLEGKVQSGCVEGYPSGYETEILGHA